MKTRKTVKRMIPKEAVMVSLVSRPSARASQLYAVARFEGATDEIVAAVERGDLPPDMQRVDVAIRSVDRESRIVRGLVYNPPWDPAAGGTVTREEYDRHVDSHGTFMTADDIRYAAHRFMAVSRGVDVNHDKVAGVGTVIESMIVRSGGEGWPSPEGLLPEGSWVMACRVDNDAAWDRVLRGQDDPKDPDGLTGYSVYLYVQYEDRSLDIDEPDPETAARTAPAAPIPTTSAGGGPSPSHPSAPPAEASQQEEATVGRTVLQALRDLFTGGRAISGATPVPVTEPVAEPADEPALRMEKYSDWAQVWPLVAANAQLGELFWALRSVVHHIMYDDTIVDKPEAFGRTFDGARAQLLDLYQSLKAGGAVRSAPAEDPFDLEAAFRVLQAGQTPIPDSALSEARAAAKALNRIVLASREEGDPTMTEEQIRSAVASAVAEALKPVAEQVARLAAAPSDAAAATRTEPTAEPEKPVDVAAIVRAAVDEAMKPINDTLAAIAGRVSRVERAAPAPSAPQADPVSATRADDNYYTSLMGL